MGKIVINNFRLYFIGFNWTDNSYRPCSLHDTGRGWAFIDLSASANKVGRIPVIKQKQSDAGMEIAVSPDGKTIAYFANDWFFRSPNPYVCYYSFLGSDTFSYNELFNIAPDILSPFSHFNSLQFKNNSEMYFIAGGFDFMVHQLKFQVDYCQEGRLWQNNLNSLR